jgi:hypothetical protein
MTLFWIENRLEENRGVPSIEIKDNVISKLKGFLGLSIISQIQNKHNN